MRLYEQFFCLKLEMKGLCSETLSHFFGRHFPEKGFSVRLYRTFLVLVCPDRNLPVLK
jgi:hypothetical protein